jgi:hypothetical protein
MSEACVKKRFMCSDSPLGWQVGFLIALIYLMANFQECMVQTTGAYHLSSKEHQLITSLSEFLKKVFFLQI